MRLSVHGSRSLGDERVRIILLEEIEKHNPTAIATHAEPAGVCGVCRDLCKELAIPLILVFLNFKKKRGAFEWRSKQVLQLGDHAVFIHDGKSHGTQNELALAQKMQLSHTFHQLEPSPYLASVGFPIDKEWGDSLLEQDPQLDELLLDLGTD